MITDYDVYVSFRKAQANYKNKAFRLPSDWDSFKEKRMSVKNKQCLDRVTDFFNTKWSNIDIDTYMECGFSIYKTFSYHMFLKRNVLDLYIENDKQRKRRIKVNKESLHDSFIHMRCVFCEPLKGYSLLESYCRVKRGAEKMIIHDYLKNKIDPLLIVYCIYHKYLKLSDTDREKVYNISNRYRDLLEKMFEVEHNIKELESRYNVVSGREQKQTRA